MKIEEKDKLLVKRKDLIILVADGRRAISKQGDLICYGLITEEEAKKNIERYEENIKDYLEEIEMLEKKLEREYNMKT